MVLKTDVQGSLGAIRHSIERLTNDEVRINILREGAGAINESDVMLASASGAIVLGFNVWVLLMFAYSSVAAGLVGGVYWLTREEGVWILPLVVCAILALGWLAGAGFAAARRMRHREGRGPVS